MKWQPIETAPKMKTVLLFAVTEIDPSTKAVRNWKMDSGFWHTGYEDDAPVMSPWCWEGRQLRAMDVQPTHWMPLPEPPAGH